MNTKNKSLVDKFKAAVVACKGELKETPRMLRWIVNDEQEIRMLKTGKGLKVYDKNVPYKPVLWSIPRDIQYEDRHCVIDFVDEPHISLSGFEITYTKGPLVGTTPYLVVSVYRNYLTGRIQDPNWLGITYMDTVILERFWNEFLAQKARVHYRRYGR